MGVSVFYFILEKSEMLGGEKCGGVRFVKGPKSDNHVGFCDDIL